MKLLYFTVWREDSETIGINQKIKNQVKAFERLGMEAFFCVSSNESIKLYECKNQEFKLLEQKNFSNKAIYDEKKNGVKRKLSSYFRLNECIDFMHELLKKEIYDAIYIRRILPVNLKLALAIRKWRKRGVKVLWEIPTWNSNPKTPYWMLVHLQELLFYSFLRNDIYKKIAIYSEDMEKNGYIFINNGVELSSIPKKQLNVSDNGINLICLATFSYWHGYDRLLKGIKKYYDTNPNIKVYVNLVGNGNVQELLLLAKELNIEKYVKYPGLLVNEDLNTFFDNMDIAIGNLGFFRQGVYTDTSIKIREYCARGIPFVTALNVNDFPNDYQYIFKVPMNESDIEIESILDWFLRLDKNVANSDMRRYAEENLSWDKQLEKVKKILE